MMTRVSYRGQGIARALMLEAERIAIGNGRTLLNLETDRRSSGRERQPLV